MVVEQPPVQPNREPGPDRAESAQLRQLPNFAIIGTQKGGTTSLYQYLGRHPDVEPAFKKEIHYFDIHFARGLDWYRAHFPLQTADVVTGEASPSYLFHPRAAERMHATIPGIRLIVLLRNPIERAFSHYQMNVRKGIETLSFEEATAREPERLRQGDGPDREQHWRWFSYVSRGHYAEQLQRWLDRFPREQLLVIKSEDFFAYPAAVYAQVLRWLSLRPWRLHKHQTRKSGDYGEIHLETRRRLEDHFAAPNRRLYDLLGRDMEWNSEPSEEGPG
jgi:hypothetical protein